MTRNRDDDDDDNTRVLNETARVQQDTLESLHRIHEQAKDAEENGSLTLEQLKAQGYKLNHITNETDRLNNGLDETKRLQNKLSRWTLTFGKGGRDEVRTTGSKRKDTLSKKKKKNVENEKRKGRKTATERKKEGFVKGNDDIAVISDSTRDDYADELQRLETNDAEIDGLLDETAQILDRLTDQGSQIKSHVDHQDETIEQVAQASEEGAYKQRAANRRARKFLSGRFLTRADNEGS